MGLFNILDPVLDAVLGPLLSIKPILGIMIISFLITLLITFIYKFTTDQVLLKQIREKQKNLQDEMKKNRGNPSKVMKLQKQAMESSMEMMRQSFKSMLFTFIPIIILFGWVGTHFAYEPLDVGQEFNVTLMLKKGAAGDITINVPQGITLVSPSTQTINGKTMDYTLKADAGGAYLVTFLHNDQLVEKQIVVDGENGYIKNIKTKKTFIDSIYGSREGYLSDGDITQIIVGYDKVRPFGSISLFGWRPGWLGSYIIFSILFSIVIRKVFKVH